MTAYRKTLGVHFFATPCTISCMIAYAYNFVTTQPIVNQISVMQIPVGHLTYFKYEEVTL